MLIKEKCFDITVAIRAVIATIYNVFKARKAVALAIANFVIRTTVHNHFMLLWLF